MPIYEFACQNCATPFEKFVRSFSAVEAVKCPECGSADVERQVSTFASHVKGGSSAYASGTTGSTCSTGGL
ncbi:MAG: zinc ribbon domain-containing protein [Caldilineae bacterium]|nr:MAG: zinc ribbon domain-containing protein [Caldilineae bacterium]